MQVINRYRNTLFLSIRIFNLLKFLYADHFIISAESMEDLLAKLNTWKQEKIGLQVKMG